MVIEPLPNANAAAKCLLKNPQRVKKSTEKVGPFETLVNLRLRRWDASSGASVLLRYDYFIFGLTVRHVLFLYKPMPGRTYFVFRLTPFVHILF